MVSRRFSLNDFKVAQAHLKRKEQSQRRAYLLRRAMTIVEGPSAPPEGQNKSEKPLTQSMNNLDVKEVQVLKKEKSLEKQNSTSDGSTTDSPTKLRPRFSSVSPTPAHMRRMSFPAIRRGSSMDIGQGDVDEMLGHHSPEVKRRLRLLRH